MKKTYFYVLFTMFLSFNLFSLHLSFEKVGEYEENAVYTDIKVVGQYAFFVAGNDGVQIFDISKSRSPVKLSTIGSLDYSHSIDIDGFNLYVADGSAGVRIFDIRDKRNPDQISFIPTKHKSIDLDISGNFCFVADEEGGLKIIDISRPFFPEEILVWDESNYVGALEVVHDYIYISDKEGVLALLFDGVDSLDNYRRIGDMGSINHIISDGRFIYASSPENGMFISQIMDVSYPLVQILSKYRGVENIFISGFYLYFAQGSVIGALNVLVPFNPYLSGSVSFAEEVSSVYVSGNLLYITCGFDGFKILKISD